MLGGIESWVSSLNETHIDLGGDEQCYRNIKHLISHFLTCCITDKPVCWILLYDYCAIGRYIVKGNRGQGLAKALVSSMSRRLYAQGYPVYCFIEEENTLSYSLFTNLGFTEDPQCRAAGYQFNY
ncbi:hypothetical protein J4Q44_G00003670 [Coregonus suidteri]|uniref:Glycine N-acyltransferase-like protein n=1 Tax=Coregonus suidteri TaxID=861788 RepID=A0AAN8MCV3_9TELE